jgi:hypothetical protein
MKKVITFSLWGNNPTYNIGAIRNAEIARQVYPDFECWFYIHRDTVPSETIEQLQKFDNVKIIFKEGDLNNCKPMMWRFEAIDEPNVEIMMSRDTDTRIWNREVIAVNEWLNSGKLFHIMRDHPEHCTTILGGMFGTKKILEIQNWISIIDTFKQYSNVQYDQDFLRDCIYPIIKNNALIHASFHKYEDYAIPFPIPYCSEYKFVGEYVYEDESRNEYNINQLINALK